MEGQNLMLLPIGDPDLTKAPSSRYTAHSSGEEIDTYQEMEK
jgi:hypothetical protein